MTYFMFNMLYSYFYLIWYVGLVIVAKFLVELLLPQGGLAEILPLRVVFGVLLIGALAAALRRGHHAAQAYGERDLSLLQAHNVAGALLRTELAFLPIVGHLFGGERDQD